MKNKAYNIPLNVPTRTAHKYLEVIERGYVKYLEAIDICGKYIMYQQFNKLVDLMEPTLNTSLSSERVARTIIKRLTELGFIESSNINRNKFLYLKKPAFAFLSQDYINSSRVNLGKDIKNDKFQISILKVEYLLRFGDLIHSETMFNQLNRITKHIYTTIIKQGNNYGYSLESIEEILQFNNFGDVIAFIQENPEHKCKIGIIRGLWLGLGTLYKKMILQKQTVTDTPEYYKLFVKKSGEVIIHYIPNIIIFDVAHDKKYYRERSMKLFHSFYEIEDNDLRDVQQNYIKNKDMGYTGKNHIGYKITLIGSNKDILLQKKSVIDEDINSSVNSPIMDYTSVVDLEIGKYTLHASRLGNKYQEKQDNLIDSMITQQLNRISKNTTEFKTKKHNKGSEEGDKNIEAATKILNLVNNNY